MVAVINVFRKGILMMEDVRIVNKEQRNFREKNHGHLPIYGVGPYYGAGIIILTLAGIVLSITGILDSGKITNNVVVVVMVIFGIVLFVEGFFVWKFAAIGKKSIDKYIKNNKLCKTGIYSIVRNPCYSGIMYMCSGVVFAAHNVWLLLLPVIFWITMTILMKKTEEKWLAVLYGQEYTAYCKKVNRCIPWFPRKL